MFLKHQCCFCARHVVYSVAKLESIESAALDGAATLHRLFGFLWLFVELCSLTEGASCQKNPSAAWCRWVSVAKKNPPKTKRSRAERKRMYSAISANSFCNINKTIRPVQFEGVHGQRPWTTQPLFLAHGQFHG